MSTDLFLRKMLSVLWAAWCAHSVELLLQSCHVTLYETEAEFQHLVARSGAGVDEAVGNAIALLMQHEVVEGGGWDREDEREGGEKRQKPR